MAIIPLNQKFHTIENSVVTKERGSALVNAQKNIYTMQDIIDTAGGGLGGTQYVFVAADGTDVENAAELQAAYVTAQGMSPSATNRITVIAAPGNYNFDTVNFVMDISYIDLVSLDGNRSIVFNGTNTIEITANDVFVRGVDVGISIFIIADSLNSLIVENCSGGANSFSVPYGTISGTFTDCSGGDSSFGGDGATASGVFNSCIGGNSSFGSGSGATASGVFNSCIGSGFSFGSFLFGSSTASGVFTNCTGGIASFAAGGPASGIFTNCIGGNSYNGNGSFGGGYAQYASGTFTNCVGGSSAFGGGGANPSGVFIDCQGGDTAFGGSGGNASGVFTNCSGGTYSFGGNGGTASGVFNSCIGGGGAFGIGGILNGKLYYCRLTGDTFETVSGAGVTRLCIDGNNVENNQG